MYLPFLPVAPLVAPVPELSKPKSVDKPASKDPVSQANMWSSIATAASGIVASGVSLTGMLNPKVRDNQLAIAEANAQQAGGSQVAGVEKKYLLIGGGILVALILAMIFMKSKSK